MNKCINYYLFPIARLVYYYGYIIIPPHKLIAEIEQFNIYEGSTVDKITNEIELYEKKRIS